MPKIIVGLTTALGLLHCGIHYIFSTTAPTAYMDEIFHVPQTQRYCSGEWTSWDSKITTFPGLYLLGTATGWIQHYVTLYTAGVSSSLGLLGLCSTRVLRFTNVVLGTAIVPVIYYLAAALDPTKTQESLILMTFTLCLFPLHFFYIFLYYTDVGSLLFLLATWLAALHHRPTAATLLAAAAVLMRQTNAVWVAFILAWAVLDACLPLKYSSKKESGAAGRAKQELQKQKNNSTVGGRRNSGIDFVSEVGSTIETAWQLKYQLIRQNLGLLVVVVTFAGFVVWNGGVVVGDKAHHRPVKHWMQLLYCLLYCTAWLAPVYWTPANIVSTLKKGLGSGKPSVQQKLLRVLWFLGGCGLAAVAVNKATLVHPFLLADNRHYTFYLWRKVLNRTPWTRYAAVPAYVYSAVALAQNLRAAGRHPLHIVLLLGASLVVLVPAHLIEFRYYTIPFTLTFLLSKTPSQRQLWATVVGFAGVNMVTLGMYLGRPFVWGDWSTIRFMW